jgi:nitrite reductase/ring-hydroxylating ferredoxin subunit
LDPPSPPFSFSLKGGLGSLGVLSCLEDNFHAILNICFHKLLERQIMISLGRGKKEGK